MQLDFLDFWKNEKPPLSDFLVCVTSGLENNWLTDSNQIFFLGTQIDSKNIKIRTVRGPHRRETIRRPCVRPLLASWWLLERWSLGCRTFRQEPFRRRAGTRSRNLSAGYRWYVCHSQRLRAPVCSHLSHPGGHTCRPKAADQSYLWGRRILFEMI